MREKHGEVFSIAGDNAPIPGCTVSREICGGENCVSYFSLAENTDISAEIYPFHKLLLMNEGSLEIYGSGRDGVPLSPGDAILTVCDAPVGMRTASGAVYTEIMIRRKDQMNEAIKAGVVFQLAELLPYAEGRIVNMDVVHNEKMKFVLMAFDAGCSLSEHAAPGEALVFALDGEAVISYEGRDYPIHAGESFCFAKAGRHAVRAEKRFKMALLLTLE